MLPPRKGTLNPTHCFEGNTSPCPEVLGRLGLNCPPFAILQVQPLMTLSLPEDTGIGSGDLEGGREPTLLPARPDVKVDGEGGLCGALGVCMAHGVLPWHSSPEGPCSLHSYGAPWNTILPGLTAWPSVPHKALGRALSWSRGTPRHHSYSDTYFWLPEIELHPPEVCFTRSALCTGSICPDSSLDPEGARMPPWATGLGVVGANVGQTGEMEWSPAGQGRASGGVSKETLLKILGRSTQEEVTVPPPPPL